jgi:cyclic beta-1,2-glucan synthetase
VLQDEPLAGLPRIYGVAWAFVAHTDSAFDEDLLVHFFSAYQETRELTPERDVGPAHHPARGAGGKPAPPGRTPGHAAGGARTGQPLLRPIDAGGRARNRPALDDTAAPPEQRGVAMAFLAQLGQRLQDRRQRRPTIRHCPRTCANGCRPCCPTWVQAVQAQQAADQTPTT